MTPQRISTWTITAGSQRLARGLEADETGAAAHAVDRIGRAAPRRDDAPRGGPAGAADGAGGPGLRGGLGPKRRGGEGEDPPVSPPPGLGPQRLAPLDRLADAPPSGGEVEADPPPLLLEPAGADPELDP